MKRGETTRKLGRIRHLALDLDGTVYRGGSLFPFSRAFLTAMSDLGVGYTFLTNNSSRSRADYVEHLLGLGIGAELGQIRTSTQTAVDYLRRAHPQARRVFLLGTESLGAELRGAGLELTADDPDDAPDAVVVGYDTGLAFARLCRAAYWIAQGRPFVATHPDRVCPTDARTVLVDCGAVTACLAEATGRPPEFVGGKPDPSMLAGILGRHDLQADELAMVGDRLYTDLAMARAAGVLGVLVLTGETTAAAAAAADPAPDLLVPSLLELGECLREARR